MWLKSHIQDEPLIFLIMSNLFSLGANRIAKQAFEVVYAFLCERLWTVPAEWEPGDAIRKKDYSLKGRTAPLTKN